MTDPAPNRFPGCPAAWCKWPACGRDCPEKAANLSHIHHRIMERRRPAHPRPRPLSRRSTPADRASGLVNGSARLLERNRGRASSIIGPARKYLPNKE
jgi:hypothetical protein